MNIKNNNIYLLFLKLRIVINQFFLKNSKFFKNHKSVLPLYLMRNCSILSKKYNFLYFRIPKAANSTVISTLVVWMNKTVNIKNPKQIEVLKRSLVKEGKIHLCEYDEIIKNYYKFSIVRNPYNRLLSAYFNKIMTCRPQKIWVTTFLQYRFYDFVSLDNFIDYLEFGGGIKNDIHWAPQTEIISIPIDKIDFIGRVENLQQDMQFITEKIFGVKLALRNSPLYKTNSISKYNELLTNNLKKRIYKIYEKDFQLLGYPK
jgi:hypothetical protein